MIGHAMHHVRQRGALAVQLSMAALAVGLVVGAGGAWVVRGWQAGAQLQTERAAYARDLAYAEAATTRAVEDARTEEQRRTAAMQEIADATQASLAAVRADAVRARAAADRLRNAATAYAAAHCGGASPDTAAAPGSASAAGPGLVLADVLSMVESAGRAMAEEADRRRIAGEACEKMFDALPGSNGAAGVQPALGVEVDRVRLLGSFVGAKVKLDVSAIERGSDGRREPARPVDGHAEQSSSTIDAGASKVLVVDGDGNFAQVAPPVVAPIAIDVIDGGRPLTGHVEPSEPVRFEVAAGNVDPDVSTFGLGAGHSVSVEPTAADERREKAGFRIVGHKIANGLGRKMLDSHDALQLLIGQRPAVDSQSLRASPFLPVCASRATAAHAAGVACERAYDTLTRTQEITP